MSIRVLDRVWRYSRAHGGALLLLLAIADHADDNGRAYPGTASLARKARTSHRNVRNLARTLEALGELSIEPGGGRRANTYHVLVTEPDTKTSSGEETSPGKNVVPVNVVSGHPCSNLPGSPATAIAGEPSYNRHEPSEGPPPESKPKGKPKTTKGKPKATKGVEVTIDAFLKECEERGEKVWREDHPIYEYADKVGIERDWLALCWQEFKRKHRLSGKRYIDWRLAFRNCVEGNWYHIWYGDVDGTVKLSSQGRLLEKAHARAA